MSCPFELSIKKVASCGLGVCSLGNDMFIHGPIRADEVIEDHWNQIHRTQTTKRQQEHNEKQPALS